MPDPKTICNEIKQRVRRAKKLTALKHVSVVVTRTSKIPRIRINQNDDSVLVWVNRTGGRIGFGRLALAGVGSLKWHKDHRFRLVSKGAKKGTYSYKMYWQLPGGKRNYCVGNTDPELVVK